MAVIVVPSDIEPFATIAEAKLAAMIDDATAMAVRAAPCLKTTTDDEVLSAAKAIIRGAILRWNDAGTGAISQQSAGPFAASVDTSRARRGMYWPSEITELQGLCQDGAGRKAFSIDTTPPMPAPAALGLVVDID